MIHDFRFALRLIASHRWFSAAVIVTLALGIGINTAVFTLVNAALFKPVPVPGGARLVIVSNQNLTKTDSLSPISWPDYLELKQQNRSFEGLEALTADEAVISEPGNPPERYAMAYVTPGLFPLLRMPPAAGRGLSANDGKPGAEAVVLLGSSVWKTRYARAADVIGRSVRINGKPATIVGVMPDGFEFPDNRDFWMPLVPDADSAKRSRRNLQLYGLLKSGTTGESAGQDLDLIARRLALAFPSSNKEVGTIVRTFQQVYNGSAVRTVFFLLLGAVGFVLLIACANAANLMLSRAVARSREISVRAALGASRWQLIRQLLIESVLLSSLGGLLGLGLAAFGVHAFDLATQNVGKPYWIIFRMDYVAFAYFATLSLFSGVLFGLVPALRTSRVDLNTALKEDTRAGGSHRAGRLTGVLIVVQFALTVVLLAGAGLMIRSFFAAQSVNRFVPENQIFTARVQLPAGIGEPYSPDASRVQFHERLSADLAALPGVTEVAAASNLPGLGSTRREIELEGRPQPNPKQRSQASIVVATPRFLPLIGLAPLAGREFTATDGDKGKEAAVVTRRFATAYWPTQPAVGNRFRFVENDKPGAWMTVVGVCPDLVQNIQDTDDPPLVFIPYRQEPWSWMALLLRASSNPAALAGPVRATVQHLDQNLPLFEVATLAEAVAHGRWFLTVFGTLFSLFALTGLLMAAVGIYAVVAQSTLRRTREIGIRMALGATAGGIVRLVLHRGLTQLAVGLIAGLAAAAGATQLLAQSSLLVARVSPDDPLVFTGITALLLAVGVFACWLPGRRAAALHPVAALRHE